MTADTPWERRGTCRVTADARAQRVLDAGGTPDNARAVATAVHVQFFPQGSGRVASRRTIARFCEQCPVYRECAQAARDMIAVGVRPSGIWGGVRLPDRRDGGHLLGRLAAIPPPGEVRHLPAKRQEPEELSGAGRRGTDGGRGPDLTTRPYSRPTPDGYRITHLAPGEGDEARAHLSDNMRRQLSVSQRAAALLAEHGLRWRTVRAWALTQGVPAADVPVNLAKLKHVEAYVEAHELDEVSA